MAGDSGEHVVVDVVLDVQARGGAAALAVVEENRVGRARDRGVEVGEHDVG
jgi:hypothetical protein